MVFTCLYLTNYTNYDVLMLLAYILNESILTGARGAGYQILYQTKW